MMGWYGSGMSPVAWVFMGLTWIVVIAVVIWLVVRLFPSDAHSGPSTPPPAVQPPAPESAADILDTRFARGEITLETYQAHRAALRAAREDT
jgi:putative membrane protein